MRHLEKALAQVRGDLLEKEGLVVRLREQVESAKREKEVQGYLQEKKGFIRSCLHK